eukprot:INCI17137.3.p1 GENE.INCI17137.3~~INCI17137.3.p1  ORF type:complete len:770 (+),score=103.90 INCI17137.3:206-2515(+)
MAEQFREPLAPVVLADGRAATLNLRVVAGATSRHGNYCEGDTGTVVHLSGQGVLVRWDADGRETPANRTKIRALNIRLADGQAAAVGLRVEAHGTSTRPGRYAHGAVGTIVQVNAADPVVRWDHSGKEFQTARSKIRRVPNVVMADGQVPIIGLRVEAVAPSKYGHFRKADVGTVVRVTPADPFVRWDRTGQEQRAPRAQIRGLHRITLADGQIAAVGLQVVAVEAGENFAAGEKGLIVKLPFVEHVVAEEGAKNPSTCLVLVRMERKPQSQESEGGENSGRDRVDTTALEPGSHEVEIPTRCLRGAQDVILMDGERAAVGLRVVAVEDSAFGTYKAGDRGEIVGLAQVDPVVRWDGDGNVECQSSRTKLRASHVPPALPKPEGANEGDGKNNLPAGLGGGLNLPSPPASAQPHSLVRSDEHEALLAKDAHSASGRRLVRRDNLEHYLNAGVDRGSGAEPATRPVKSHSASGHQLVRRDNPSDYLPDEVGRTGKAGNRALCRSDGAETDLAAREHAASKHKLVRRDKASDYLLDEADASSAASRTSGHSDESAAPLSRDGHSASAHRLVRRDKADDYLSESSAEGARNLQSAAEQTGSSTRRTLVRSDDAEAALIGREHAAGARKLVRSDKGSHYLAGEPANAPTATSQASLSKDIHSASGHRLFRQDKEGDYLTGSSGRHNLTRSDGAEAALLGEPSHSASGGTLVRRDTDADYLHSPKSKVVNAGRALKRSDEAEAHFMAQTTATSNAAHKLVRQRSDDAAAPANAP